MTAEEFLRQIYIHGMPYEDATRYENDASAVPTASKILNNREDEEYWSNAVQLLGIAGKEDQADVIIDFLQEGTGKLTRHQYTAKSSAVTALGYLVHRTGSRRALDYLISGCAPDVWSERVHWTSPIQPSAEDRSLQLAIFDVWALALSGHPEAGEALRSLSSEGTQAALSDVVEEALAAHDFVSKEGLVSYYKRQRN